MMCCPYCNARDRDQILTCPICALEGCEVCIMSAGRGCPCVNCEDAMFDERDPAAPGTENETEPHRRQPRR